MHVQVLAQKQHPRKVCAYPLMRGQTNSRIQLEAYPLFKSEVDLLTIQMSCYRSPVPMSVASVLVSAPVGLPELVTTPSNKLHG